LHDRLSKIIITIYLLWWGVWLSISTLNVFGLFQVSIKTYSLLLLNIVMVLIGFIYGNTLSKKTIASKTLHQYEFKLLKNKTFIAILIMNVLILLHYFVKYNAIVGINTRMERFVVGQLFSSTGEILFYSYFIGTFMYALYAILAYLFFYQGYKNPIFLLVFISILLYAGIGSGREPIIISIVAITLVYFIRKYDYPVKCDSMRNFYMRKEKTRKRQPYILIILLIFGILIYAAWLTAIRMGYRDFNIHSIQIGVNALLEHFIIYYTGPFRALDYGLVNYVPNVEYLWGRGTFAGIDEIFSRILRLFGFSFISSNNIIGGMLQNNFIHIGNNHYFNFAYTSVMIHYFDLGVVGVIVFPFFYGFFVRNAVFLYNNNKTLPALISSFISFSAFSRLPKAPTCTR
jgi:oligosaccharide repeat unit polymerase